MRPLRYYSYTCKPLRFSGRRLFCRHLSAGDQLRPVRGHGVRQEGDQQSHGFDVLLAEHTVVQCGAGQGQDAGPQGPEEHREPHAPAKVTHHTDETYVSQLGVFGPSHRLDDHCVLFDIPGVVPAAVQIGREHYS